VLKLNGEVPSVPDRQLDPLRELERLAAERAIKAKRRRGKRGRGGHHFSLGDTVRVPDGPFAGLDGIIVPSRKNGSVRVEFCGGMIEAEIEPWLVQAINLNTDLPEQGVAAHSSTGEKVGSLRG